MHQELNLCIGVVYIVCLHKQPELPELLATNTDKKGKPKAGVALVFQQPSAMAADRAWVAAGRQT